MPRRNPNPADCTGLRHFSVQLRRRKASFPCPKCTTRTMLLSKDFEKHCARHHHMQPRLCCVWCDGNISWLSGQKHQHVDHMIFCWQRFMARYAPLVPRSPDPPPLSSFRPDPILHDLTPHCPKEDFFGHEPVFLDRLHDPIWPVALGPNALTYSDEGLNLAAACVQMYAQLRNSMEFLHVSVRLIAFPSFLEAMDADEGRSRTLPFSTLCDGGRWPQAIHRQHRHMIVVSPRGHFHQQVWKKVTMADEDRPQANYPCRKKWNIKDSWHFIHLLSYLSRRESSCQFTKDESQEELRRSRVRAPSFHHFWIFTTLPRNFRLPLFVQYENGIMDLLIRLYPDFSLEDMLQFPLVYHDRKWKLKIKHLPSLSLGHVLPVTRDLRPSATPTPAFVHLLHGEKMYFRRDCPPEHWIAEQVELGNLFYHAVGEEYFTLRPRHQYLIQYAKPVYQRNQELLTEKTRLQQQVHHLQRRVRHFKMKSDRLQKTTNLAQRRAYRCQKEKETLQRNLDQKSEQWEREKKALQRKINRMNDQEIARLREENTRLKRELNKERRRK